MGEIICIITNPIKLSIIIKIYYRFPIPQFTGSQCEKTEILATLVF